MRHLAAIALAACAASRADGPVGQSVCVQIEGADNNAYLSCLNADLAHRAAQAQAQAESLQTAVQDAAPASTTQAGLYNQAATRQRLGSNFGHGVRPPQAPQAGK